MVRNNSRGQQEMTALGYTVRAAAKKLGVNESTIEGAIRDGELRAIALPGRKVFITCPEIEIWLGRMPDWIQTSGSTDQPDSANREPANPLASLTTSASFKPTA